MEGRHYRLSWAYLFAIFFLLSLPAGVSAGIEVSVSSIVRSEDYPGKCVYEVEAVLAGSLECHYWYPNPALRLNAYGGYVIWEETLERKEEPQGGIVYNVLLRKKFFIDIGDREEAEIRINGQAFCCTALCAVSCCTSYDAESIIVNGCKKGCKDADGDGYPAYDPVSCPEGNDCNDTDPSINPGAQEICDGKDNNCSGETDETCLGSTCTGTDMGSMAGFATGNLYHSHEIITTDTLSFTLSYNSLDTRIGVLGRGWTHTYNMVLLRPSDGTLLLIEGDGRRVYFRDDGAGTYRPDPSTGDHSYILIEGGYYQLIRKEGTVYYFDLTSGRLLEIIDRNNNITSLGYTGDKLTRVTDPYGRRVTFGYDEEGRLTEITDPLGRVTRLHYSEEGYLITVTDPGGNTYRYTYDDRGRLISKTDPSGNTTYTYDSEGRVITSTNPSGTKTIDYDQVNNTVTVTERDGSIWRYTYDPALNVITEVTDPQGNTTTYTYDENRNLLSETDPLGNTTTYTYDEQGNLLTVTDPQGNTTTYTYNQYGQITSVTDPEGNITTYTYDERGNLTSIKDPTGAVTTYEYDVRGNIVKITDPRGNTTLFGYDQYGNITSITDPSGNTTTFEYDQVGNLLSITDPTGAKTTFQYNNLNQLIKVTDPSGNTTTYTYDARGNRTSITDANGNTTYFEYDHEGNLIKVTDALGNITTYTYGSSCPSCGGGGSRLTSITDASGNTTTYQYDILGRLVKETDPLGNTTTYTYDAKGNLISKTDAEGNTITYRYDSLNRLIKKTYPDGTSTTFTYDARGNIITAGNEHITYTFTYDATGRLKTVTDSRGNTITYEYDATGNRIKMTTPEGRVINYSYDAGNRLSQINSDMGSFGFSYDASGRRTSLTYPNGITTTYNYDQSGRLLEILSQVISYSYTYDRVGNRLSKTEDDKRYDYAYDAIYRLLQSLPVELKGKKEKEKEGKAEVFTYDPVGNRLTGPRSKDYYFYNQGNQLTEDREYLYEYDRNGNLIRKTEVDDDGEEKIWTYSYDYENRLIKVVKEEEDEIRVVTFKYDPFGRRIEKEIEDIEDGEVKEVKTHTYVYDNEDIILEYVSISGHEEGEGHHGHQGRRHNKHHKDRDSQYVIKYLHGPGVDEPLAIEQKGRVYYYHADGLGSITALTDYKGRIVQRYEYDSFGNMKHRGHKVKQPYTFTGREWDKEIGLYYYRARYYDPEVGRFISFDPILHPESVRKACCGGCGTVNNISPSFASLMLNPQSLNPYVYVGNNPINRVDPEGLFWILDCAKCFYYMRECAKQGLKCKEEKCIKNNNIITSRELFNECFRNIEACQRQLEYCSKCAFVPKGKPSPFVK